MKVISTIAPLLVLSMSACSDVEKDGHGGHDHEHEVISTVELTFTAEDDSTQVIRWVDGEGQDEDIVLALDSVYNLGIRPLNELEQPIEDITPEIIQEADEHQVFFTGSAIDNGLVVYTYNDSDDEGLPLGIDGDMDAVAAGSGDLTVTLRHLALQDGEKVKVAGMADTVAEEGLNGISGIGDNDFSIDFALTVQ